MKFQWVKSGFDSGLLSMDCVHRILRIRSIRVQLISARTALKRTRETSRSPANFCFVQDILRFSLKLAGAFSAESTTPVLSFQQPAQHYGLVNP